MEARLIADRYEALYRCAAMDAKRTHSGKRGADAE
ncbi:MAG: hypothetical protein RJA16_293, partial [Planctomycetota bacterium]